MTTMTTTDCTPATLTKRLLDLVQETRDEARRITLLAEIESDLCGVQYNLRQLEPGVRDAATTEAEVLLRLGWCLGRLHTRGNALAASRHIQHRALGVRCASVARDLVNMVDVSARSGAEGR
jgi:hypothetical protein